MSMIRRQERNDLGPTNHSHDETHGTLLFMFLMWTRSRRLCHRWQAGAADLRVKEAVDRKPGAQKDIILHFDPTGDIFCLRAPADFKAAYSVHPAFSA